MFNKYGIVVAGGLSIGTAGTSLYGIAEMSFVVVNIHFSRLVVYFIRLALAGGPIAMVNGLAPTEIVYSVNKAAAFIEEARLLWPQLQRPRHSGYGEQSIKNEEKDFVHRRMCVSQFCHSIEQLHWHMGSQHSADGLEME